MTILHAPTYTKQKTRPVRHGIGTIAVRPAARRSSMPAVVPPLPPKLRAQPRRTQIGDSYADEAEFTADLAAWEAERSERQRQTKLRAAAQDKLRDRSQRSRGTAEETDTERRSRKRREKRLAERIGRCPQCQRGDVELVPKRGCKCMLCAGCHREHNVRLCPSFRNYREWQDRMQKPDLWTYQVRRHLGRAFAPLVKERLAAERPNSREDLQPPQVEECDGDGL